MFCVSWKIKSVIPCYIKSTGASCGNQKIEVALSSELSLHLNMIMHRFSVFPSEISVSSHTFSCPSKDAPVPFISSFFLFPFQISLVRMKTKIFLKNRMFFNSCTWAWVSFNLHFKPRKLLWPQMSLVILLKSEHMLKCLLRKSSFKRDMCALTA